MDDEEDDGNLLHAQEGREVKHKAKLSKKTKLGGFLNMGFSKPVFDGIMRTGYKTPTPIQRSAIPVIMSGQDVVAMARTGSGKTACYLLPMLEALKTHCAQTGVRALILEPTRELAEQTLRFAVKLGKFTGLHCTLVVGGDSMDEQFGALHKNPDIIIATPGRLMHVCSEMDLRLNNVQYVVFDEADRLFELGFREQLDGILERLIGPHQRLLFSATLPKMLVDFASSGIRNPALIRLDKDDQLSQHLELAFFSVAPSHKLHVLLYILRFVLLETEQVIVFAATQLHVQYLECVMSKLNIPCTYLYSDMDPTSRKINAAKFQKKIVNVLIATDIAARGIDIPNLDYVINYNFPGTSKVFVHRVGRAARAGKSGVAFSLVAGEEEAYLWDLHKFLGRPVMFSPKIDHGEMGRPILIDVGSGNKHNEENKENSDGEKAKSASCDDWNFQFGKVPLDIICEEAPQLDNLKKDCEVAYLDAKKDNAYKLYQKTRPKPSKEALREMRETKQLLTPGDHPMLKQSVSKCLHAANSVTDEMVERRMRMMEQLANVRPKKTIFELGAAGSRDACRRMQLKRKRDDPHIAKYRNIVTEKRAKYDQIQQFKNQSHPLQDMDEDDIYYTFGTTHRVRDDIHRVVEAKGKKEMEKQEQDELKAQRELKKKEKFETKFGAVAAAAAKKGKSSGDSDASKKKNNNKKKEKKKRLLLKQLSQQQKPESTDDNKSKPDYFIPYRAVDADTEKGYSVHGDNFAAQSRAAQLELLQDDHSGLARQRLLQKWDSKKSKFVGPRKTEGKIKTESGRVIRSSYKTDRYETWLKRNRMDEEALEAEGGQALEEDQEEKNPHFQVLSTKSRGKMHPALVAEKNRLAKKGQVVREEVRNPQQIVKHLKEQKKYKADRERGHGMKKLRMKLQGGASKARKQKPHKDAKGKKKSS